MLKFLFPRLTADPDRGAAAFATLTKLARDPGFFVVGKVPDTLDGRFAVLASVTALALVRIERESTVGDAASVALTERFIESMEAEHRELGMSDPTLGKTVRKLVGLLSRRVDLWREVVTGNADWLAAARSSLFAFDPGEPAVEECAARLQALWARLSDTPLESLMQGELR